MVDRVIRRCVKDEGNSKTTEVIVNVHICIKGINKITLVSRDRLQKEVVKKVPDIRYFEDNEVGKLFLDVKKIPVVPRMLKF